MSTAVVWFRRDLRLTSNPAWAAATALHDRVIPVRRYVPELAKLDAKTIQAPWKIGPPELQSAGVELGVTYPEPIVDHGEALVRTLAAYETARGSGR